MRQPRRGVRSSLASYAPTGLHLLRDLHPRLAPWAIILRRYAAGIVTIFWSGRKGYRFHRTRIVAVDIFARVLTALRGPASFEFWGHASTCFASFLPSEDSRLKPSPLPSPGVPGEGVGGILIFATPAPPANLWLPPSSLASPEYPRFWLRAANRRPFPFSWLRCSGGVRRF
jgi:hypothetical protein